MVGFSLGLLKLYVCLGDMRMLCFLFVFQVYGKYVCFIMYMVCVLCASCGSPQYCVLVEDARGILQSRSHDCLIGSHECLLLFTPSCCGECFYYL